MYLVSMNDDQLKNYDFLLPKDLIAQKPSNKRSSSRMLVINRENGKSTQILKIEENLFKNISNYLREGDLLVFNDSKVVSARIECFKETGGKIEVFILDKKAKKNHDSRFHFRALVKPKKKLQKNLKLLLSNSENYLRVENLVGNESKVCTISSSLPIDTLLKKHGMVPLPPYINRRAGKLDEERYQTIYAKVAGSLAAPTAGLHFDQEVFSKLADKKIDKVFVTLHVGLATFNPINEENIANHEMHAEPYSIKKEALEKILKAKNNNKRIIAVGTTSLRVLESLDLNYATRGKFQIIDFDGEELENNTDIFIRPGYKFKLVDGLITNFHLPKSSLLVLICAFLGRKKSLEIYQYAIKKRFRFFSYGDVMLAFRQN